MSDLESCPRCSSVDTCEITYGYPTDEEKYLKLVAEKKIFPGGFTVKSDSSKRYCNTCQNKWGLANLEKTDFFDFKEEFNVKVIYNQSLLSKILFWIFTVTVGFVNPLFSIGLIILYYLPGIIQSAYQTNTEYTENVMKSCSKDILEDMK